MKNAHLMNGLMYFTCNPNTSFKDFSIFFFLSSLWDDKLAIWLFFFFLGTKQFCPFRKWLLCSLKLLLPLKMGRFSTHLSLYSDLSFLYNGTVERSESKLTTAREMERTHDRNDQRIGSNGWWKHTSSKKCNKFLSEKRRIPCAHETAKNEFYSNDLPNGLRNATAKYNTTSTAFHLRVHFEWFLFTRRKRHLVFSMNYSSARWGNIGTHCRPAIYARHAGTFLHLLVFFSASPRIPFRCYLEVLSFTCIDLCFMTCKYFWSPHIFAQIDVEWKYIHLRFINLYLRIIKIRFNCAHVTLHCRKSKWFFSLPNRHDLLFQGKKLFFRCLHRMWFAQFELAISVRFNFMYDFTYDLRLCFCATRIYRVVYANLWALDRS